MFDNQELHKLKFVSLILMTHTVDLRVAVYGEIRNLSLLGAYGLMKTILSQCLFPPKNIYAVKCNLTELTTRSISIL